MNKNLLELPTSGQVLAVPTHTSHLEAAARREEGNTVIYGYLRSFKGSEG